MVNLIIYIVAHGRPDTFNACLEGVKRFAKAAPYQVTAWPFVVCTQGDEENIKLCRSHCVTYIEAPNDPLGAKFNAGLEYVKRYKWTHLMQLGSDDILSNRLWGRYYAPFMHGVKLFGVCGLWVYHKNTGKVKSFQDSNQIFGAGRVISRQVIEKLNYRLWDDEVQRGLDNNSYKKMMATGAIFDEVFYAINGNHYLLDIKEDGKNINEWDTFPGEEKKMPTPELDFPELKRLQYEF